VGAKISVVGRGFGATDVVKFDDLPVQTRSESANALSFIVPAVETGRNYRVTLEGAAGSSPVGTFRVDGSPVTVSPSSLSLRTGEVQSLTFTLPSPAPTGGLFLDVTTDIPDSVIMPEVVVPAGRSFISVDITGGQFGSGSLFLGGSGASGGLRIPVTIR
ncbi:MAG: cell surface protein, partial [Verrucomicrobia bacterium]